MKSIADGVKGPLDKQNADKLLEDARKRIGELRSDVHHAVGEKFSDRLPKWVSEAEKIAKAVDNQAKEIDTETEKVQKLLHDWTEAWNIEKVKTLQKDLESADSKMKKLQPLADLHDAFESLEMTEERHKRDYSKRASLILAVDGYLRSLLNMAAAEKEQRQQAKASAITAEDDFQLQESMLKALREDLIVRKESLTYDLYEEWGETFRWDVDKEYTNRFIVNIGARFEDVVTSLKMIDLLEKKMGHLSRCLLNYLFVPLLTEPGSKLQINEGDKENPAEIVVTKPAVTADQKTKVEFSTDALDACFKIFKLLKERTASEKTFAQHLTEGFMLKPLKELIVDSVLKPAVPADAAETSKFNKLLAACDSLLRNLKDAGLVSEETSFNEFAANVDVLFLTKRCQFLLEQANRLIGADLHQTVQVGGETKADDAATLKKCLEKMKSKKEREERETTPLKVDFEKPLPPLSEFPQCRVSESVVSLLELIVKTLDEACNATKPLTAARLYHSTRSMVEMYLDLVDVRHEHQLRMVPQTTAVFYNNCSFLCHHFLMLGAMYEARLRVALDVSAKVVAVTFVDFIPRLKELATNFMEQQVQMQTKYLIDCLKPAEGFKSVGDKVRAGVCQKAVKASSMQFQHIHRVWKQVLPLPLLFKFQGAMGEELLRHIVKTVVKLEDIAEADAKLMYDTFNSLLTDIDNCFMVGKYSFAHRFCENSYYQFKECLFILNASLTEIEDRWTVGPLSDCMDALEVKQMVRALFQNTDKRAAVIAKIK